MLRRSFLSGLSGFQAFAFLQSPVATLRSWQAARHAQDDWFDENSAKHRVLFDTWNAERFPDAMQFAGNYLETNKTDYELPNSDLAVVIVFRHRTTPFAFNDAMWAKYGKSFSDQMKWVDPNTHEAPTANPYATRLAALSAQGIKFAICNRTTRAYSNNAAQRAGAKPEDVKAEMMANIVGPGHFVPAGVIAVTRAQERGYANISIG